MNKAGDAPIAGTSAIVATELANSAGLPVRIATAAALYETLYPQKVPLARLKPCHFS